MTAEKMKQLFLETLDRNDEVFNSYEDLSNEKVQTVQVHFSLENMDDVGIMVSFAVLDDGGMFVNLSCYDFFSFGKNYAAGLMACNQLSDDESFNYYIDEDKDAVLHKMIVFSAFGIKSEFSAELVLITALRMALSADDAYPILAKAKFS